MQLRRFSFEFLPQCQTLPTVGCSIVDRERRAGHLDALVGTSSNINVVVASPVVCNELQTLRQGGDQLFIERPGDAGRLVRSVYADDIIILSGLAFLYEVFSRAGTVLLRGRSALRSSDTHAPQVTYLEREKGTECLPLRASVCYFADEQCCPGGTHSVGRGVYTHRNCLFCANAAFG